MPSKRKVLMLTNSESGQANVFLATTQALRNLDPDVDIHFASFEAIKSAVVATSAEISGRNINARPIKFHEINGMSSFKTWIENPNIDVLRLLTMSPGFWETPQTLAILSRASMPWTGPQLLQNFDEVRRIIKEVQPDLTIVDNLFTPGLTAVRQLGIKYIVLSPNTLKDFAAPLQPWAAFLWKYPCVGSGFPFPVPWHLIPLNVIYVFVLIFFIVFDSDSRTAQKYLAEKTGARIFGQGDLIGNPPKGLKVLVSSHPELDFPISHVPQSIIPCGPILREVPPVIGADPELHNWLSRGPTIFINLGSLSWTTEEQALEMAHAIISLQEEWRISGEQGRLQFLWKLNQSPDGKTGYDVYRKGCGLEAVLGGEFDKDAIRVVSWVAAEPYAVLQSGHVVCSVNHGGANSFWEALSAGVPQVVLPVWADTYDFAYRAEFLGIGKFGNRKSAPRHEARELVTALQQVVVGENARDIQERAKHIARLRLAKGEGRDVAARHILEEMSGEAVRG
ncbi:glycosyltransferase family 1 protein [Colletotrichum cereale]|nr:glycosyltransferase family 1 protein [Colletotrichum cereale]